jgi:hypothetical protein
MYVQRNTEVHSSNNVYSRKAINITYSEIVFVGLGIQHAMHILYIAICGLPDFTFFHIIS